jgi:quinoprotein glucose dehydrogenase
MGQSGAKNGDWRFYGGDAGSTKYSPLDQINRDNVKDLRIAWRWRTENFGARPDFNLESTPLMVDGVLYATAGARRNVVAINGVTGETLWMWRYDEGTRAQRSPRFNSGRGVAHWTDGKDARILYITPGYRLIALDAKSGRPSAGFGVDGIVDLWEDFDQPSPKEGQIGSSSPPMIVGDVAIVGAAMQAGGAPNKENVAGHVRGYDVRTGKRVWIFHTVPKPGEFGHDTWLDHSSYTGNTAVWAPMSADLELGYVYLPVETPTGDFYGGHRPGNNLFGDSIVCLDARTGKLVWHFRVHLPRHLGLRHPDGADTGRHHRRWPFDQSRCPDHQAGLGLCLRSRHWEARVAD